MLFFYFIPDMWHAKLMERRDWLLEQERLKTNESLRTNSVINPDDLFGIAGTFTKFEVNSINIYFFLLFGG